MATPEPGAKVAKDLGIYLGQVYAYIKKGTVQNFKEDGYPNGKGVIVDPDEVRAAMSTSRRKGGKGTKSKTSVARSSSESAAAEAKKAARREKLTEGQLVSYHRGTSPLKDGGHSLNVVVGRYRNLTYLHEGDRYHQFSTDKLRELIAKGIAHLESPENLLGLIIFHYVSVGKLDLAISLEKWMEKNGIEVSVPEPQFVDDIEASVADMPDEPAVEDGDDDD